MIPGLKKSDEAFDEELCEDLRSMDPKVRKRALWIKTALITLGAITFVVALVL